MPHIGHQLLHRGGFWTIKSFVHALGIYLQMTESTTNSASCIFIKQLNSSDHAEDGHTVYHMVYAQHGLHPK